MKKIQLIQGIAVYFLLFVPGDVTWSQIDFNKDSLDAKIRSWLPAINEKTPGYILAVISKGKQVYTNYNGFADLEFGHPISENSIFNIGSVSKQFTAFLILQLEREGQLSTEDLASKYLPEYPILSKYPIRISHLLHHTSGLREILELMEMADGQNKYGYTTENIKQLLIKQRGLNFSPGQKFQYINTNYFFLGQIIEKVSGKSYPEYCREKIFVPLEMNTAFVMSNFKKPVPFRAKGYIKNGEDFENATGLDEFYGANGIHCSIKDLGLWAANFTERKTGDENLFAKFGSRGKLGNGQPLNYGYGLMFGNYKGVPMIDHNGARWGYRAQILYLPTKSLAIVALANFRSFPITDIPLKIADYILDIKSPPVSPVSQPRTNVEIKEVKKDPQSFTGIYWNPDADIVRKFYIKNGVPTYFRNNGNESSLVQNNNSFYLRIKDSVTHNRLYFPINKNAGKQMIFITDSGDSSFFNKMDTVSTVKLSDYSGSFYCDEIDATLHFTTKDDSLMLSIKGWPVMKLQRRFNDYFDNGESVSFYFQRNKKGEIISVIYDWQRTRHLSYKKI